MQVISGSLEFLDKPRDPDLIHLVICITFIFQCAIDYTQVGEAQR
jgi:hypothetical protein